MLPLCWAIICGATALVVCQAPVRFTPMTVSQTSSVISSSDADQKMPALAQATSSRPNSARPRSTTASRASWLRTSATSATQRRPVARTPSAVSFRSASVARG